MNSGMLVWMMPIKLPGIRHSATVSSGKLRSDVVVTKIEKCLGRFNVFDFGEESTTSLPLFLSYECFNSGTKNLLRAKIVLVD